MVLYILINLFLGEIIMLNYEHLLTALRIIEVFSLIAILSITIPKTRLFLFGLSRRMIEDYDKAFDLTEEESLIENYHFFNFLENPNFYRHKAITVFLTSLTFEAGILIGLSSL